MLRTTICCAVLMFLAGCAAQPAPAPVPVEDRDRDGVIDQLDLCPGSEAGIPVDVDGCPADSDLDGVFDHLDLCPETPDGVAVDSRGCPFDTDGDGVSDDLDSCPETPAGTNVDAAGCARRIVPSPPPAPEPETLELKIHFRTGGTELTEDFAAEFRRGAAFIEAHPSCVSVIEGHTDNVGPADYNRRLALRRAEVVRDRLAAVLGRSLQSPKVDGYGESRPVADNGTQAGRQKNRRVVIAMTCGPADQ